MRSSRNNNGYTLVEILVALAMAVVVLGSIFFAFKSQQDSYVVQSQVTVMQQTLRGAMYMITRDVQMAGYYTNFDPDDYTMNWDNLDGDDETIQPLLYARNNLAAGGDGVRDGTDVMVIVKGSLTEGRELGAAEYASGSTLSLSGNDLDGDGDDDLQAGYCGVLVQSDLGRAEFFELSGSGSVSGSLSDDYAEGDRIHRADVIIYYVDDDSDRPGLRRNNLGNNDGAELVAENIENFQVQYQLDDDAGTWVDDPRVTIPPTTYTAANVRAVRIFMVARTDNPIRGWNDTESYPMWGGTTYTPAAADSGFRRKTMTSVTEVRNIGS
jgi:type II secretory pathway pseudopilin PulG